jgi:hypothetical protein
VHGGSPAADVFENQRLERRLRKVGSLERRKIDLVHQRPRVLTDTESRSFDQI